MDYGGYGGGGNMGYEYGFEDNYGGGFDQMNYPQQGGFEASGSNVKTEGKRNRDRQNLLPMTVKQALSASYEEDEFRVDGQEIFSIKIYGFIGSVEEHSTNLKYSINDCTGSILCTVYVDKDVEKTQLRVHNFVRVTGQLKEYQGSRYIGIYSIEEVTSMNELTHHLLEVGLTHLARTKGPIPGSGSTNMRQTPSGFSGGVASLGMGGYSGQRIVQNQQGNDLISRIKTVLLPCNDEEGMGVQDIMMGVNRISETPVDLALISKTMKEMAEQGAVYTSVDEDHYLMI